jgi:hypothetical protein
MSVSDSGMSAVSSGVTVGGAFCQWLEFLIAWPAATLNRGTVHESSVELTERDPRRR